MDSEKYANVVSEIARQYVCENKSYQKAVIKTVMSLTPTVIFTYSHREPTEDQFIDTLERHNPFAVDDISEEIRTRYTAVCKLELDVLEAIQAYRSQRSVPTHYRLLEDATRYLTWIEAAPELDGKKNDEMAEFHDPEEAAEMAHCYCSSMSAVGIRHEVLVVAFNRFHERIS